jgi:hypothetical protein
MDIQIKNYSFDKTAKTVTFTDYTTIRLDSIRVITNVESNIVIYNFAQPNLGGSVLNNVLTLDYNTSAMGNTDKLQIVYNDDFLKASKENQALSLINEATLNSLVQTLNELSARLEVLASMANSGAPSLRVTPIASVSTAVTGSLTTLTTLTNFGTGYPASEVSHDINNYTAIMANIINVSITA